MSKHPLCEMFHVRTVPQGSILMLLNLVASEELFLFQKCDCMVMSCCCPLNHVTSNKIKSCIGENHLNSDYDILVRSLSTVLSKPD